MDLRAHQTDESCGFLQQETTLWCEGFSGSHRCVFEIPSADEGDIFSHPPRSWASVYRYIFAHAPSSLLRFQQVDLPLSHPLLLPPQMDLDASAQCVVADPIRFRL